MNINYIYTNDATLHHPMYAENKNNSTLLSFKSLHFSINRKEGIYYEYMSKMHYKRTKLHINLFILLIYMKNLFLWYY